MGSCAGMTSSTISNCPIMSWSSWDRRWRLPPLVLTSVIVGQRNRVVGHGVVRRDDVVDDLELPHHVVVLVGQVLSASPARADVGHRRAAESGSRPWGRAPG